MTINELREYIESKIDRDFDPSYTEDFDEEEIPDYVDTCIEDLVLDIFNASQKAESDWNVRIYRAIRVRKDFSIEHIKKIGEYWTAYIDSAKIYFYFNAPQTEDTMDIILEADAPIASIDIQYSAEVRMETPSEHEIGLLPGSPVFLKGYWLTNNDLFYHECTQISLSNFIPVNLQLRANLLATCVFLDT